MEVPQHAQKKEREREREATNEKPRLSYFRVKWGRRTASRKKTDLLASGYASTTPKSFQEARTRPKAKSFLPGKDQDSRIEALMIGFPGSVHANCVVFLWEEVGRRWKTARAYRQALEK